jgi:hypothetical protein
VLLSSLVWLHHWFVGRHGVKPSLADVPLHVVDHRTSSVLVDAVRRTTHD